MERVLIIVYLLVILMAMMIAPLGVYSGGLDEVKYGLVVSFWAGAALLAAGYFRVLTPGPRVLAYLVVLLGKAVALFFLGAAFFASALGSPSNIPVTPMLLLVYSCFAGAAATLLLGGLFVFFGATRGWLTYEVYKWPWSRDKKK